MSTVERLARIPGLGLLLRIRHAWVVRTSQRWLFHGVFDSYEAALAGQPRRSDLPEGYRSPGMAMLGGDAYARMHSYDYPVVYWLRECLGELSESEAGRRLKVVDLGGHLGEKRGVWAPYAPAVEAADWIVCETEDAVAEARRRGLPSERLSFSADPGSIDGASLLIASGSLQYLPWSATEALAGLRRRPPILLFNKVPLSDGPSFWTLQNLGRSSVPYRVFHGPDFLAELDALGYELVDRWEVPPLRAGIPFRPDLGTRVNSGVLLRLR